MPKQNTPQEQSRKQKHQIKFNKNYKTVRFIRKLLNKIISKASKDLNCYQLQKLLFINCKNMQDKMKSFVNASPNKCSAEQTNKRKRKRNDSIVQVEETNSIVLVEETDLIVEDILNNISLISAANTDYDSTETDEMSDEELQELKPKHIRVKQSLKKIAKIRKLPDYKRIEKLLNENDELSQRRKHSLNSIVTIKRPPPFWNTHSYLLKQIEHCVTKKYWNKLTTLLIYLSSAVKKCEPYLLKATIINFISNPTTQIHEILEEFLKECCSCRTEEDINNLLTQLFHIKSKTNISV